MKSRSNVFRVIDRYTAKSLGRVLMMCYKRGVNDACRYSNDEGMLREHIEQTRGGGMFGFVSHVTAKWVYWKNRLLEIGEEDLRFRPINDYFNRMGKFGSNYLSVFMVLAQTFYNRGIEDWLDNPGAEEIGLFNERTSWWGVRRAVDSYRLRSYVQDVCAEHIETIEKGGEDIIKQSHYEIFMNAFSFSIVAKQ